MMGITVHSPSQSAAVGDYCVGRERRATERTDCHTVVSVLIPGRTSADGRPRIIKGRSEDVSVSGARIVSLEPISEPRVFLRFLLPTFGDRFIEAEIVTESAREHITIDRGSQKLYAYGVRFIGVAS